jgi:hypothetical protein
MTGMADFLIALAEVLLEGYLTRTGRRVLSLVDLKTNVLAETFLGLLIWILVICLALALFAALV